MGDLQAESLPPALRIGIPEAIHAEDDDFLWDTHLRWHLCRKTNMEGGVGCMPEGAMCLRTGARRSSNSMQGS